MKLAKMLKKFSAAVSVLIIACMLAACSSPSGDNSGNQNSGQQGNINTQNENNENGNNGGASSNQETKKKYTLEYEGSVVFEGTEFTKEEFIAIAAQQDISDYGYSFDDDKKIIILEQEFAKRYLENYLDSQKTYKEFLQKVKGITFYCPNDISERGGATSGRQICFEEKQYSLQFDENKIIFNNYLTGDSNIILDLDGDYILEAAFYDADGSTTFCPGDSAYRISVRNPKNENSKFSNSISIQYNLNALCRGQTYTSTGTYSGYYTPNSFHTDTIRIDSENGIHEKLRNPEQVSYRNRMTFYLYNDDLIDNNDLRKLDEYKNGGTNTSSGFESGTWKYQYGNTTQNIEFRNGTITTTAVTGNYTARAREASYELDDDTMTITYSLNGYSMSAEFEISIDGTSMTLDGGDDNDAIGLLGAYFEYRGGDGKMTLSR